MSECTACAASNMAIGDALDEIRLGRADVMFAGGTEAPITQVGIAGFDAMRALSRRNDDPKRASRPFDDDRDGLVMGEAAGVLVLEELRARAGARREDLRRAARLRHLRGRGAHHRARPDRRSPARAMTMALADAGVDPTEIGYVNAHATSTPLGDAAETQGDQARARRGARAPARRSPRRRARPATASARPGAIEAIFTTLALRDRIVPPTINFETPDPACDLDYVPNVARRLPS